MTQLATTNQNPVDQAPAPKPRIGTIGDLLTARKNHLSTVCTKYLDADRLLKMIATQLTRTPKLSQCSPMSVLQAAMTCAELGLAPGVLGNIYLIPFENRQAGIVECQLIVGYRGFITLAGRAGIDVSAYVVYRQDEFSINTMGDPPITHKPRVDIEPKDSDILGAYMVARMRHGTVRTEWMTKSQIDKIRGRSRAGGSGPWVTDYAEMCKKTVIRRGCKTLPLTPELEEALGKADVVEFDQQTGEVVAEQVGQAQDRNAEQARSAVQQAAGALGPGQEKPQGSPESGDEAEGTEPAPGSTEALDAGLGTSDANPSLIPGATTPTNKPRGRR